MKKWPQTEIGSQTGAFTLNKERKGELIATRNNKGVWSTRLK